MVSAFACLLLASATAAPAAPANSAADVILVHFTSDHCGYCKQVEPAVRRLELDGVPVRHVNIQKEPEIAQRFGVTAVPEFVVLSGSQMLTRHSGVATYDQLQQLVASAPPQRLVPTRATNAPPPQMSAMPSATPTRLGGAGAIERARAATVRLRVHDASGYGVGSGTVIDTHGDEALVLTCGHLFRDTAGKGRIEVDVFVGNQPKTVAGTLVDYDADKRDIALVSIRPGTTITPVPVVSSDKLPQAGDAAFSFGCDRGADPSLRDTRLTAIDKYVGPSNLEIAGAPIDGRSGGGLFDSTGRLIGVCNAADFDGDIGIYAGPGVVHWQLDRVELQSLYQPGAAGGLAQAGGDVNPAGSLALASAVATVGGQAQAIPAVASTATGAAADPGSESEIICIVRDRSNPNGSSRVVTFDNPSAELLRIVNSR